MNKLNLGFAATADVGVEGVGVTSSLVVGLGFAWDLVINKSNF